MKRNGKERVGALEDREGGPLVGRDGRAAQALCRRRGGCGASLRRREGCCSDSKQSRQSVALHGCAFSLRQGHWALLYVLKNVCEHANATTALNAATKGSGVIASVLQPLASPKNQCRAFCQYVAVALH